MDGWEEGRGDLLGIHVCVGVWVGEERRGKVHELNMVLNYRMEEGIRTFFLLDLIALPKALDYSSVVRCCKG